MFWEELSRRVWLSDSNWCLQVFLLWQFQCPKTAGMGGIGWVAWCFGGHLVPSGHSLPPGINKKIIRILWGFIIVGCLPSEQATSNIESSHEKKCRLVTLFFSRGKCIVKCTKASVVCSHWTQCCFYLAQRAGGRKKAWHSIWMTVFPVVGFDHDICVMWGHKQHVHKPQLD